MNIIIEYIKKINIKKTICLILFVLIYLIGFIYLYYKINNTKVDINTSQVSDNISFNEIEEENVVLKEIYVDIKGEVKKPGVYKLDEGSRVNDLIKLAGGLSKNANTRFINLSKVLLDGDAIVIYSNSEIKSAQKKEMIVVETPCICEKIKNDACIEEKINSETEESLIESKNNKININVATKEELTTLTGIGESKATAIIQYRTENGLFKSIEDLVKVNGISETIFSKIKENITI